MQYGPRADVQVLAERMADRVLAPLQAAAGPIGDQGLPGLDAQRLPEQRPHVVEVLQPVARRGGSEQVDAEFREGVAGGGEARSIHQGGCAKPAADIAKLHRVEDRVARGTGRDALRRVLRQTGAIIGTTVEEITDPQFASIVP